ncbi:MAG TPA: hypothetical protein DCZ94_08330 [Lentisphaeria bacterium]|nr:MAG: hypothetical protein A2X48_19810 [Lentisphaerae bacterium GWF2_49_21]HBC86944.1 hypothetical protein [Lentisphaeria bacterium]
MADKIDPKKPNGVKPAGSSEGQPAAQPVAIAKFNYKVYFIFAGVLFIIICVFFGMIIAKNASDAERMRVQKIAEQRAEEARIAKENQLREEQEAKERAAKVQEEKWTKALSSRDEAVKNPALINVAIANLTSVKTSMPGTDYEKKASAEIANLHDLRKKTIEKIISDLEVKTGELVKNKEFEDAAAIYKDYSGALAQETAEERLRIAEKHLASARAIAEDQKKFNESKIELLKSISGMLVKNKASESLAAYNDFIGRNQSGKLDDIAPVKTMLETMQSPEKFILENCKSDVGGKITVKMDGAFTTAEISRIKEESVYVKRPVGTAMMETKISLANLSPEEKIKRSDKMDKASRAVFSAVMEVETGNYENAEKALEPGGILTEYLAEKIKGLKKEIEDKKAVEIAKLSVKEDPAPKEFVFTPQHITIKVDANTKNTNRQTLIGDVYVIQDISMKVSLTNTAATDFTGYKVEAYVVGDNTSDKHICQILMLEKKDLSIKKKETVELDMKGNTEFNKMNVNKYGAEYGGYMIIIKDKSDKIFSVKTNKPALQKLLDKIVKMDELFEFDDRTGEERTGPPPPVRR